MPTSRSLNPATARPLPASIHCRRLPAAVLLSTWTATAMAGPAPAPEGSFAGDVLAVVLPILFIIAALLAVLYFARRRYGLTGRSAPLSVMQVLPVGPRERIVLVRTRADRVFAVGVSAHSLNLIAQLEPEDVATDEGPATPAPQRRPAAPLSTNNTAI